MVFSWTQYLGYFGAPMTPLPLYQVYLKGEPYFRPVLGRLAAIAVYMSALQEGQAEIKLITRNSKQEPLKRSEVL